MGMEGAQLGGVVTPARGVAALWSAPVKDSRKLPNNALVW